MIKPQQRYFLFTMLCVRCVFGGTPGHPGSLVPDRVVWVAAPVFVLVESAWSNQMRQLRSIHPAVASSSSLTVKLLTLTSCLMSLHPVHASFLGSSFLDTKLFFKHDVLCYNIHRIILRIQLDRPKANA